MKIQDIADEIFRDLNKPSDLSIPAIAYWVRTNIGALNNLIFTSYSVDCTDPNLEFTANTTDGEVSGGAPVMTVPFKDEEKAIMKSLYAIHYYDLKIRGVLGAAGYNSALEVTANGATVRLTSKTEIAKAYMQAKKMEVENRDRLVMGYNKSKAIPAQVAGDDTQPGLFSPQYDFNRVNDLY
jgi:hypothetical protein